MQPVATFLKNGVQNRWVHFAVGVITLAIAISGLGLSIYAAIHVDFDFFLNGVIIFLSVVFAIDIIVHVVFLYTVVKKDKLRHCRIAIFVYVGYQAFSSILMIFLIIYSVVEKSIWKHINDMVGPTEFPWPTDLPTFAPLTLPQYHYYDVITPAAVFAPIHIISVILFVTFFFVSRDNRPDRIEVQIEDVNVEERDNVGLPVFTERLDATLESLPSNQRPPEYTKRDLFM
ncbi:hypothetical protein L596_009809 [Steinernema carpocapsae]|uniref:Uncharacterized protein n=1 Tax=Steinernema carpocapsae TaxID=34508 RepID=A0A4U5PGE6_STECR|nr:hypothetical protein L596_009809 [Steinernema carpocapsae]